MAEGGARVYIRVEWRGVAASIERDLSLEQASYTAVDDQLVSAYCEMRDHLAKRDDREGESGVSGG